MIIRTIDIRLQVLSDCDVKQKGVYKIMIRLKGYASKSMLSVQIKCIINSKGLTLKNFG